MSGRCEHDCRRGQCEDVEDRGFDGDMGEELLLQKHMTAKQQRASTARNWPEGAECVA